MEVCILLESASAETALRREASLAESVSSCATAEILSRIRIVTSAALVAMISDFGESDLVIVTEWEDCCERALMVLITAVIGMSVASEISFGERLSAWSVRMRDLADSGIGIFIKV